MTSSCNYQTETDADMVDSVVLKANNKAPLDSNDKEKNVAHYRDNFVKMLTSKNSKREVNHDKKPMLEEEEKKAQYFSLDTSQELRQFF